LGGQRGRLRLDGDEIARGDVRDVDGGAAVAGTRAQVRCNGAVKRLGALAGITIALSFATGSARGGERAGRTPSLPLLGIVGDKVIAQQLVRFDPASLRPLPGGVPLAAHHSGWSFSPNGRELVLGNNNGSCTRGATSLRQVDVAHLRSLGDIPLATSGPVLATSWPDATHLLAVIGPGACRPAKQTRVVSVDILSGTVLTRTWLRGMAINVASAPHGLVILLAPSGAIGSARLAVVDASGRVREKTLEAIPAGRKSSPQNDVAEVSAPGLAVDPATGRAFVFPGGDLLAEVDLSTLRVGYHDLAARSLAKGVNGSERAALSLGHGLLAVTGTDSIDRSTGGHPDVSTSPAGLRIVDTRGWTYRTLDPQISRVQLVGGRLFALGSSYAYDGTHSTSTSAGLTVYSLAGRELYHLFDALPVGRTTVIGGRGYASVGGTTYRNRTISFDLATGRLGRSFDQPLWELLLGKNAAL
jgi:hypothetical protein